MDAAGLCSRALFAWMRPMMVAGFKAPLQPGDTPPLPRCLDADTVYDTFAKAWSQELLRAKERQAQPSLQKVFVRILWFQASKAILLQALSVVIKFGAVLVLRRFTQIIVSLQQYEDSELFGEGLICAFLLFLTAALSGTLEPLATQQCQLTAYRLYISVAQAVMYKGAKLHPGVQANFGRGDLVSLALSDLNRVIEMSTVLMQGVSTPFLLVVAFSLLIGILGPSVLVTLVAIASAVAGLHRLASIQGASFRGKMGWLGKRLSTLNEMLQSVRFTKYYVLEDHYEKQMMQLRHGEEQQLLKMKASLAMNWPCAATVPLTTAAVALSIHVAMEGSLPDVADTMAVLAVARLMYLPFAFLGGFLGCVNMLINSLARVRRLLLQPEISRSPLEGGSGFQKQAPAVCIDGKSFSWSQQQDVPPALSNIDLEVPQGELWAVVGGIGAGKSSLLSAILGNMGAAPNGGNGQHTPPVTTACTSRTYVAQEPMVMNASIRDNIMFGISGLPAESMDTAYQAAVAAAALVPDLDSFPAGDLTEVGEKGITLSGGQKARVALARAVMASRSGGLVLLDDPLAAVDAHVGEHLFQKCIVETLQGTTRLLVTNQLHFLSSRAVSRVLVMEGGRVVEQGRYAELTADARSHFSRMLESVGGAAEWERQHSKCSGEPEKAKDEPEEKGVLPGCAKTQPLDELAKKGELVKKETKQEGAVTMETVKFFIQRLGGYAVFVCLVLSSWLFHLSELGPDVFLASWQDGKIALSDYQCLALWLTLGVSGVCATIFSRVVWVMASMRACREVHVNMLQRVLHCPTSFFDRTPSGRVMNRLGEDLMMVDWTVGLWSEVVIIVSWQVVDMCSMVAVARPLMAPFIVVYLTCFMLVREVHRRSSRETIRWWMVTKSPVFNLLEEWFSGAPTIYAFGREKHFIERFQGALRTNMEWMMARDCSNLWTEQRHSWIGSLVISSLAVMMLLSPDAGAGPALAAVSVIQALLLSQALKTLSFMMVQVEGSLSSVERVMDFTNSLEQEPPWRLPTDADRERAGWPGKGPNLVFEDVCVRYLPAAPRALNGLTATFEAREKIGIVGRTGSGKSTMMGAIFRLFDLEAGRILLGGADISQMGVGQLRRQVTIVPQDPILFSGDMHKNLDPLGIRSPDDVWKVLKKCSLSELVSGLQGGLSAPVSPGGSNFSVGERQVLCLARALLREAPVLCLDEATANVDPVNDQRIQHILQEEMQELLVLTIAHRLHTVMHSDRILVLDKGSVAQLAPPDDLLEQPGIFQSLAQQAGIKRRQEQNGVASVGADGQTVQVPPIATGVAPARGPPPAGACCLPPSLRGS